MRRIGRGRLGGRTANRAEVRDAMEDQRVHVCVGLVVKRPNDDAHYEIVKDDAGAPVDVLVEVDLMPRGEAVTARLGALAGGPGCGIWRIPPAGTEVVVSIPRGELENGPCIVGELSTRGVPGALDQDTLVVINPGKVIVASKNDKVYVGSEDGTGTQPMVLGNSLETRLSDLEAKFIAHTHPVPAEDVHTGAPPVLVGTTAGGATSPTTSTLPHSTDNIKAQKGEVK
jgi:hypothetical protein